jgi:hypothetical protein
MLIRYQTLAKPNILPELTGYSVGLLAVSYGYHL